MLAQCPPHIHLDAATARAIPLDVALAGRFPDSGWDEGPERCLCLRDGCIHFLYHRERDPPREGERVAHDEFGLATFDPRRAEAVALYLLPIDFPATAGACNGERRRILFKHTAGETSMVSVRTPTWDARGWGDRSQIFAVTLAQGRWWKPDGVDGRYVLRPLGTAWCDSRKLVIDVDHPLERPHGLLVNEGGQASDPLAHRADWDDPVDTRITVDGLAQACSVALGEAVTRAKAMVGYALPEAFVVFVRVCRGDDDAKERDLILVFPALTLQPDPPLPDAVECERCARAEMTITRNSSGQSLRVSSRAGLLELDHTKRIGSLSERFYSAHWQDGVEHACAWGTPFGESDSTRPLAWDAWIAEMHCRLRRGLVRRANLRTTDELDQAIGSIETHDLAGDESLEVLEILVRRARRLEPAESVHLKRLLALAGRNGGAAHASRVRAAVGHLAQG